MTLASRGAAWGLVVVVVGAVVIVVASRRQEGRQRTKLDETVTAAVTRPPRQWTATIAAEQTPPPDCAALADGGFSCGACRDDTQCPAGQSCFVDIESGRTTCQGSECAKTEDCPRGLLCRVVARTSRGEPWRACVLSGARPMGAACDADNGGDPAVSCRGSLICVQGGCAQACVEDEYPERTACVAGVPCVKTDNGWGCVPSCKHGPKDSCREGKSCEYLSVDDPTALCIHKVGANCLGSKGGCPRNADCIVETNARDERTTFSCVARCTPGDVSASCPADSVCVPGRGRGSGHCRRRCTPAKTTECSTGESCTRVGSARELWFCSAA